MELREYVDVLRARKSTVVLAIVLFVAAAMAVGVIRPDTHTAQARVLVSREDPASVLLGMGTGYVTQPDRDMQTHAELVKAPGVAEQVIERLKLDIPPGELTAKVTAAPVGASDLLAIDAEDTSPARAAAIANTFAAVYIEQRAAERGQRIDAVRESLAAQRKVAADRVADLEKRGGSQAQREAAVVALGNLDGQLERLDTGRAMDLTGARLVVSAATSRTTQGPGLGAMAVIGLALGLAFGVGAAFVGEHFDSRVRSAKDLSGMVSVIGGLPAEKHGRQPTLTMLRDPAAPAADAYRLLRRCIGATHRPSRAPVVFVASPVGGGHAAAVSANLALAIAQAGERVTLIDSDFRAPLLGQLLGVQGVTGLSDVLLGMRQLGEVSQRSVHQRLHLVPAGAMPPSPAELLASPRMWQVLDEAATHTDWVIVSGPALLDTADGVGVLESSDRLLLVVRSRETRRDQVSGVIELLARLRVTPPTQAVLVGVADDGRGIRGYVAPPEPDDGAAAPVVGAMDALRPGEAVVR